ncbi:MAG: diphosphate--fructose-6-phosphate 1-phosphotransferase [Planctomycetaceae bacterium]|jgi:6-phosphofructokinase 1|nr:diphosphate--fructose-6-phosphate 1-phosphotransferase [Planctomycetaceae bacterium]
MKKNVIIAQSGGPTCVINSSLRGVIDAAREFNNVGTVYGAAHGIEGVLKEELINLSDQSEDEIALLRYTPVAGSIGTCRYKLKSHQEEDFKRTIDVLKAHNIGYFLYNGGNDSMDTANKIAQLAKQCGLDLQAIGVPKTIDNDVGDSEFKLIDHTPGYASTAKYWIHAVQYANEENKGSSPADPVLVLQAMGRKIGFIPAAARLADPKREMPLLICLAESKIGLEVLGDQVTDLVKQEGRCIVVVSEGFDVGEIGVIKDSFGHTNFSASQITVAQIIINYLNKRGLPAKGAARGNVPGTDQRHSIGYASTIDLDEAYKLGQKAMELAATEQGGFMSTILREKSFIYNVKYDKVKLEQVANSERTFPSNWITKNGTDVTDDFIKYAKPFIGEDNLNLPMINGRQRLTQFKNIFAEKKLPAYIPEADRKK